MSENLLHDRERALENAFFARQQEALLRQMREADRTRSRKAALAAASGIADDAVLDHLVALNLTPEGVAALRLAPLVLVAWADGSLDIREKGAVLQAAQESGLDKEPAARALLDSWLASPPPAALAEAWRGYAQSVAAGLPEAARATLRAETLGRARRVAEAAGGFLGLTTRVSEAETRLLASLEAALKG